MKEIIMPKLGLNMTGGIITKWYLNEGDMVSEGESICAIETDKLTTDIESNASGVLLKILVETGLEIPIKTPICYMGESSEILPVQNKQSSIHEAILNEDKPDVGKKENVKKGPFLATPIARRLAKENNINLNDIKGSGINGRIEKTDVDKIITSMRENVEGERNPDIYGARDVSLLKLQSDKMYIPQNYYKIFAGLDNALKFIEDYAAATNMAKINMNAFIMKAAGQALAIEDRLNSTIENDRIIHHEQINLAMAVFVENEVIFPVIKDINKLKFNDLSLIANELSQRAKEKKLKPDEMTGGTFSISNLEEYGIHEFSASVNPPEAAILSIGAPKQTIDVINGATVTRHEIIMTLTVDQRVISGANAAEFSLKLKNIIENPYMAFFN